MPAGYWLHQCEVCAAHNPVLTQRVLALAGRADIKRSHFFAGRYENIYLPQAELPQLDFILEAARQQAASMLRLPLQQLRLGFWVNLMQQGEVTQPHTHDDSDELLAGTYYIQAPVQSGKLLLTIAQQRVVITPRAGMFVFFAPEVLHEVTTHNNPSPRISLGFNIGMNKT